MTATTATLTDFLLARIADDEVVAKAASPGPWHVNAESDVVLAADDVEVCDGFALSGPQTRATTAHIARHDPARVLAECAAKRAIVEALVDAEAAVSAYDNDTPNNPPSYWQEWGNRHALRLAIEAFAAIYADHPDHRDEWRP